jgi:O-antigen/teichoic acid export membrane protein
MSREETGDAGEHRIAELQSSSDGSPTRAALDSSMVHSLAWTGAVKWTIQLVTWLSTFVIARLLMPEDFGLVAMATVFLGFVTVLSEFGLGITVVTMRELGRDQLSQLNGFAVVLGITGMALAMLAAFPLSSFFYEPRLATVMLVLSATFFVTAFKVVPGALLQRDLLFKELALIEGLQGLIQSGTTILLAWIGWGYWALVAGAVCGNVVAVAAVLAVRNHPFAQPRLETLRTAIPFSRDQLLITLSWFTYTNVAFVVAGRLLGAAAVGIYTLAWTLARALPEKIATLILRITPAYFSAVQDDPAALRRYLIGLTEFLSIVLMPMLLGLAVVADDLVALLGDQWSGVVLPLRVLAIFAAYDALVQLHGRILTATRQTSLLRNVGLITTAAVTIGMLVGARWGPAGLAAVWLLVHPWTQLPIILRSCKQIQLPLRRYLQAFQPAMHGSAWMIAAVIVAGRFMLEWAPLARLATQVATGCVVYAIVIGVLHRGRMNTMVRVIWDARRSRLHRPATAQGRV